MKVYLKTIFWKLFPNFFRFTYCPIGGRHFCNLSSSLYFSFFSKFYFAPPYLGNGGSETNFKKQLQNLFQKTFQKCFRRNVKKLKLTTCPKQGFFKGLCGFGIAKFCFRLSALWGVFWHSEGHYASTVVHRLKPLFAKKV